MSDKTIRLNALDYSADPTGDSSSSAAIQMALEAAATKIPRNGEVLLPAGLFKLKEPIRLPGNVRLVGPLTLTVMNVESQESAEPPASRLSDDHIESLGSLIDRIRNLIAGTNLPMSVDKHLAYQRGILREIEAEMREILLAAGGVDEWAGREREVE